MLFIKLVRFFFGYIRITLSGAYPERFLNLCATNGIAVWNVRRKGEAMECVMFSRDFRHIRRFRRRCGVKVHIKRRRGMPFIVHRYRKRQGIAVGLALFIAVLMTMPKYVWVVKVSGNETLSDEQIRAAASKSGILSGARLSDIDPDNLRPRLLLDVPELSWAAINIEGSVVTIDVREGLKTEKIDSTTPCNLVATMDGVITSVYIEKGSAAVKVGDAVRKGDLVALGTVEYGDLRTVMCHAMGEVYAQTERKITVTSPLTVERQIPTGKTKTKRVFQIFGLKIPLYLGSEQYDYIASADEKVMISGDTKLPLSVISAEFCEVKKTKITLTTEEAKEVASAELERREEEELCKVKIKERKLSFKESDGNIILTASYICEENIAAEAPLTVVD